MTASSDSKPSPDASGESPRPQPVIDPTHAMNPPLPPHAGYGWAYPSPPARSKRAGLLGRLATGLVGTLLLASIAMNIYLGAWFRAVMAGPSELTVYAQGDQDKRIVILPVNGLIDKRTAKFVHRALDALRHNPPKAVVLRVDSGGGGVSASDRIWHDLVTFKRQTGLPLVVSFGAVAASGGYYIAAPADHIVAEPTSITGSIGVIAQAFTVESLLQKIGVTPELISATAATKKDMLNPLRSWSDDDRQALRLILDQAYDRFVDVVAQGRPNLTLDQVRQLATGEVYTSQQAQQNELIDELGYLDAAIDKAKTLAGLASDDEPLVTIMSPPPGLGVFGAIGGVGPDVNSVDGGTIRRWAQEISTPRLEYRWIQ